MKVKINSVRDSIWHSVIDSIRNAIRNSVGDSIWRYGRNSVYWSIERPINHVIRYPIWLDIYRKLDIHGKNDV